MKRIRVQILMVVAMAAFAWACESLSKSDGSVNPQSGTGGSMARFAITDNSLYIVTSSSLDVYDISSPDQPAKTASRNMGVGIETIFPYQDKLFIGANDGLYIYDNTKPSSPSLLTKYVHVMSCDPVVAQGNYAYVTLRAGQACRNWTSLSTLDVVDFSDPRKPVMVHSQGMDSPYGLGISGDRLFVCEGEKGLKVMDISNPTSPALRYQIEEMHAYDVIANRDNSLILTGHDGIFQMTFHDNDTHELLSIIPVE